MKISLRLVGCAAGFTALALTGALAQSESPDASFSFVFKGQFDFPGTGNQTRPQKINDTREIAGIFVDGSTGASLGFVRRANGSFNPAIMEPNDAGNLTEVRGINNSRLVCGDYLDSLGAFEGFFLQGQTFTNYAPEPTFTLVLGVNNVGDFCGSEIPSSTGIQSGYTNIGGVLTDFTVQGASATLAYQINASNQVCGYYNDASGVSHGYFRESNGTIHARIDPVGSTQTILFGNNDRNLIVGRYADASGVTHGILFVPPSTFVVYDQPGATFTSLNGINNNNQVTGRYTDPSTFIDHGIILQVVRTPGGGVTLPLASASSAPAQAVPLRAVENPAY